MSEQSTPETDALAAYEGNWDTKALRMTAHARKLERKRDEARQKMADALQEVDLRTLDYERMKQERDEARELVKAYQDYTQLLGDEISDMAALAYVHGWRSKRHEQCKLLQDKIKQLEGAK